MPEQLTIPDSPEALEDALMDPTWLKAAMEEPGAFKGVIDKYVEGFTKRDKGETDAEM